jgi:mannose-6-phosphate isomerase-like protein (cupin superfamily)
VIGPAGVPHGFTNSGPGPARLVCIHAAPAMKTDWVD